MLKIAAFDTETTGVDVRHGNQPFMVTYADNDQNVRNWTWEVDPYTRRVLADQRDMAEIEGIIGALDTVVFQNPRFDVAMLCLGLGMFKGGATFPWHKVVDTLMADHLLFSSARHDLTSLGIRYLRFDAEKYDKACETLVKRCRSFVRQENSPAHDWRIAEEGLPELPSVKAMVWKLDLWLPRQLWNAGMLDGEDFSEECVIATETYAETDAAVTIAVWNEQEKMIEERGLGKIYKERLDLLPVVYDMEQQGVSINRVRTSKMIDKFREESDKAGDVCNEIADRFDYDLQLPKSGNNTSLSTFAFDVLALPVLKRTKGGAPGLDKDVIEEYTATLPPDTDQSRFVQSLQAKRKRDTAVGYMESYERFWRPVPECRSTWKRLHPSLNPTGTNTLRFGSKNPNGQNISKQEGFNIRWIFGPLPGREWWSLDAKNIEIRIPAYESEEEELIRLFEAPDEAPYYGSTHLLNFHTVYPDIWDEVFAEVGLELVGKTCKKRYASTWYQWCKNGGFAVQYGAVLKSGDKQGTADKAFHRRGSHRKLKERFSKLDALDAHYVDMANETGFVHTLPDKDVDPEQGYPLECPRGWGGQVKPTIPLNYHTQGTAMWWMCRAMIRCDRLLQKWREEEGFDAVLVMQIHDELVFDFPKGSTPEENLPRAKALAAEMEKGGDGIGIPTPVGIEYHRSNWAESEVYA